MNNEAFLSSLPLRFSIRRISHFRELSVARAYTKLGIGDASRMVVGHGCHENPELALTKALGEAHEHVWLAIYFSTLHSKTSVNTLPTRNSLATATPPSTGKTPTTFFGSAFHFNRELARAHAMNEAIERSLCAKLWHGSMPFELQRHSQSGETLEVFSCNALEQPFSMAFCISQEFISAGACLSSSNEQSEQHALNEALMIHEEYSSTYGQPPERHAQKVRHLQSTEGLKSTVAHIDWLIDSVGIENRSVTGNVNRIKEEVGIISSEPRVEVVKVNSAVGHCFLASYKASSLLSPEKTSSSYPPIPLL